MILLNFQYRIISCQPIASYSLPGNALARMDAAGAQTRRAFETSPFTPADFEYY